MNWAILLAVTATVDDQNRILIQKAKPGDQFEIQVSALGMIVLRQVKPDNTGQATVERIEKRKGFSVGVLNNPIDELALKEALAEFP